MTEQDRARPTPGAAAQDAAGMCGGAACGGPAVRRRVMLSGAATAGVALPLLAACGGGNGDHASHDSSSGGSGGSGSGSTKVAVADVPVGGGTILKDAQVVVTQPTKGSFKAFSAICTHQGCLVASVTDGQIVCPCHGSHYSITTGKPLSGPAPSPLPPKKVSLHGGDVTVA
jgi:nitrite reductase/ring-hydroxylating ferredoxin subunit